MCKRGQFCRHCRLVSVKKNGESLRRNFIAGQFITRAVKAVSICLSHRGMLISSSWVHDRARVVMPRVAIEQDSTKFRAGSKCINAQISKSCPFLCT